MKALALVLAVSGAACWSTTTTGHYVEYGTGSIREDRVQCLNKCASSKAGVPHVRCIKKCGTVQEVTNGCTNVQPDRGYCYETSTAEFGSWVWKTLLVVVVLGGVIALASVTQGS